MSAYTDFIVNIAKLMSCERYLELGIENGNNIYAVSKVCKRCIGVDNNDINEYEGFELFKCTTDEFFESFNENVDLIFIDANHDFDFVKRDFANSLNFLSPNGVILIHDTDPVNDTFLRHELCSDSYRIIDWIKESYKECNVITLPIGEPGMTIVNRDADRRSYHYTK